MTGTYFDDAARRTMTISKGKWVRKGSISFELPWSDGVYAFERDTIAFDIFRGRWYHKTQPRDHPGFSGTFQFQRMGLP